MQVDAGYLEDSYFKRTPWKMGAGDYGRVIVHDNRSAYYVRMFDSLRGLDPNVFFTPGKEGYLLFASNLGDNRDTWRTRIPVRIRAMVLAQDRLFVAGPPDVVDPQDPLGAFEGRKGGQLFAFDTRSGEKVVMHALASPPVFNGAAAASERLYIVERTREGHVLWLFGQQLFNPLTHDLLAVVALPVQLTVPPIANATLFVDQVDTGPHAVAPRRPRFSCRRRSRRETRSPLSRLVCRTLSAFASASVSGVWTPMMIRPWSRNDSSQPLYQG